MKKGYYLILILFLTFPNVFGQPNEMPVASTKFPECKIITIFIENNTTKATMIWKPNPHLGRSTISFSSNIFIIDRETNHRFQIKLLHNHSKKLELNSSYYKNGVINGELGEYVFTMTFPKLPPGVENIDIVEEKLAGFVWPNMHIENPGTFLPPDLPSKSNPKLLPKWNEPSLIDNWVLNGIDEIEGIYERIGSNQYEPRYKLAVKKKGQNYEAIYLEGADTFNWRTGDTKALIIRTARPDIYKTDWFTNNKKLNQNAYTFFKPGLMTIRWTDGKVESVYLKLYPTYNDESKYSGSKSSGSGFALSSDGYIVTNNHVIENADKIQIRGIKSDFLKAYNAKIIIQDKNNDLAILKIDDKDFDNLGSLPYKINNSIFDSGTSVFALGYPLRASMGDEIKLTNGIISSKTGFQGDITSYQTSVPVQPGNSGGPLFDLNGNVIGVISSKHIGAENASYAIKTSYLLNLLQSMDHVPTLGTINKLASKTFPEQVKSIKEFVYIIEVN